MMDADEITKLAEKAIERRDVVRKALEKDKAPHEMRGVEILRDEAFYMFYQVATPESWIAQADRIAALEKERDEAVEALRPFSEEAQKWQQDDECPDLPDSCIPQIKHPDDDECDNAEFDVGDLREAARIISAHDKGE